MIAFNAAAALFTWLFGEKNEEGSDEPKRLPGPPDDPEFTE